MVLDLNIPEPILSKQLIELSNRFLSYGSFNRSTGFFRKNYFLKSKKRNEDGRWSVVALGCFILIIAPYFSVLSFYLAVIFIFLGIMIVMNEVFDRMNYLRDFKL